MGKYNKLIAMHRVFCTSVKPFVLPGAFACAILIASSGPAFAFNSYHAHINDTDISSGVEIQKVDDDHYRNDLTNTPSSSVADSCFPLLKSIHYTSSSSATDRNQRSAGNSATFGLVVGLRFALSPTQKASKRSNKPQLTFWQPSTAMQGDRAALAVSSYRDCQKEKALKALSGFKWKR